MVSNRGKRLCNHFFWGQVWGWGIYASSLSHPKISYVHWDYIKFNKRCLVVIFNMIVHFKLLKMQLITLWCSLENKQVHTCKDICNIYSVTCNFKFYHDTLYFFLYFFKLHANINILGCKNVCVCMSALHVDVDLLFQNR